MRASCASMLLAFVLASAASAVTQGQQDDFTESENGWQRGTASLGGPGGEDDGFLALTAVGLGGSNSRLVTFNQAQWSGDYLAAGVQAIALFLNNLGSTDLQVRLALGDNNAPLSGGTWFSTTESVELPAGSGWRLAVFELGSADLTNVQGSATYAQLMAGVATLRILHGDQPQAIGDVITATLGVDRVLALPEPGASALLGSGVLALAACARQRARARRARN